MAMAQVAERRRHARTQMVCPAVMRDTRGRIVFRGRSADVSPCGVKVVGPPPADVSEGKDVWLELHLPNPRSTGPRRRRLKLAGYVRRVTDIGTWKSVIVIITENRFSLDLLMPNL